MRRTRCHADWIAGGVLALAVAGATAGRSASAQALAEAARRAEEQRKANQGQALTVDKLSTRGASAPVQEVALDLALLNRYGNARAAVGAVISRDPYLCERVSTQALGVPTFRAFADVLGSEPSVLDQLQLHGFTAKDFVLVEVTLRRALSRVAGGGYATLSDVENTNTYFVWHEHNRLQMLRLDWEKADRGVWFWPDGVPY